MTNEQIAGSLVNMRRGGYAPQEVINLIIQGIKKALESRIDALMDEIINNYKNSEED